MDNKENAVKIDDTKTIPLAYHEMCMTRNAKTIFRIVICWAVSLIAAIGIFAYMWLQYDYVSTEEYSGVYNVTDSEGNVITSDITAEDVIRILQELNNGNG